ncbi:MAG: hypothetical protein ABR551_00485 [Gemmatimonadales bacterium]
MKPVGMLGWALIVGGALVLALGGVSYLKDRDSARIGPIEISAEERGFISPLAGVVALVLGAVLVATDRRRST